MKHTPTKPPLWLYLCIVWSAITFFLGCYVPLIVSILKELPPY